MKSVLVLTFSLFSICAGASTWSCDSNDPARPESWPNYRVVVDFDSTINSVKLIQQIPNDDGTFSEEPEELFSVQNKIRGGFKVAFCDFDNVHISDSYGMVNISSSCSHEKTQDPLRFIANFRKDQDGYLQTQILESNGNVIGRNIRFSACK